MANRVLLTSSFIFGLIHLLGILYCTSYLMRIIIICGTISSILNHATTNDVAKWLDRVTMWIAFFLDLHFITWIGGDASFSHQKKAYCYGLLASAGAAYFLSKTIICKKSSLLLHLLAHFSITVMHLILMKVIY